MSSGARVTQEPQKASRMTSLAAHVQSWGLNIEDDVIYLELSSCTYYCHCRQSDIYQPKVLTGHLQFVDFLKNLKRSDNSIYISK